MRKPYIAVVGSINLDLVIQCEVLPQAGETLFGSDLNECYGGKGANQAVAAARAGSDVLMIGRVGDDSFGARLRDNLTREAVDCQEVLAVPGPSGFAMIAVDSNGENSILVVPGANAELKPEDVFAAEAHIAKCDLVALQLECPQETVLAAIDVAKRNRIPVLLDPAPAPSEFSSKLLEIDWICPNESEAASLTGRPVSDQRTAETAAVKLHEAGAKHVVITRGDAGCLFYDGGSFKHISAPETDCVDSTAAGDAFAGALSFALAADFDVDEALEFACAAGALACTSLGAQTAISWHEQIVARIELED
ncbi:MAG: ribokinase [Planctomycetota bacterium]